jgi:hypothetical protein
MKRYLSITVLAAIGLFAEDKTTQTLAFPAGGVMRLKHSIGDVNIEAWDSPNVEITTIKSSNKVIVTAEVHGDELSITTAYPRRRPLPPSWPFGSPADFNLEYHIMVPRAARLAIDLDVGSVNVDGVTGDIDARVRQGEIMLHLPEDAKYSIDAKTDYGNVNSDFPGELHRAWFSQKAFESAPRPAHTLKLRVGYGDIILLKTHTPKYPEPGAGKPNGSGL